MSNSGKKSWTFEQVHEIYHQAFMDLLFQAHTAHRAHFNPHELQLSALLSIKTGACPEDCSYCSQSAHYKSPIQKHKLLDIETIVEKAKEAQAAGAQRFCMGAAWRNPPEKEFPKILEIIKEIKALGLETCMTLGMLTQDQANALAEAGLDFYNHNIDTSPEYYQKIISTRSFQDRLDTLACVEKAGMNSCCGGILGLGESTEDRISFLHTLANLSEVPKSVPINQLIPSPGTPLENQAPIDNLELVRVIATARILMPTSYIRLSAGRNKMSDELHALCFFAGANSIFLGEKLLTAENPDLTRDYNLWQRLQMQTVSSES